jgi:hypothetical protein
MNTVFNALQGFYDFIDFMKELFGKIKAFGNAVINVGKGIAEAFEAFMNMLQPLGIIWEGSLNIGGGLSNLIGTRFVSGALLVLGIVCAIVWLLSKPAKYFAAIFIILAIAAFYFGL